MSEGYFPEGIVKDDVDDKIKEINDLYANVKNADLDSQYKIVCDLLELMPYSTTLLMTKGDLLVLRDKPEWDFEAKKCYQDVLEIDPLNSLAKLNLGQILLYCDHRADLAMPLFVEAKIDYENCYQATTRALKDCQYCVDTQV